MKHYTYKKNISVKIQHDSLSIQLPVGFVFRHHIFADFFQLYNSQTLKAYVSDPGRESFVIPNVK